MFNRFAAPVFVILFAGMYSLLPAFAQQPQTPQNEPPKTETVVDGLDNPMSVAVQPGTGHVFVSESGRGQIVRIVDGKPQPAIVGFAKSQSAEHGGELAQLGIAFLDNDTLVVCSQNPEDGSQLLLTFAVPAADAEPVNATDATSQAKLELGENDPKAVKFVHVACAPNAAYVTAFNQDDSAGWVAKAEIKEKKVESVAKFIDAVELAKVAKPAGITLSPRTEIVVTELGKRDDSSDSALTFFDAKAGKLLGKFETNLRDIVSVCYGPRGRLYALDLVRDDSGKSGLFRLVATRKPDGCQPRKIMDLDLPTSMAFDPAGILYVTLVGSPQEGSDDPTGKLIKITGLLEYKTKSGD